MGDVLVLANVPTHVTERFRIEHIDEDIIGLVLDRDDLRIILGLDLDTWSTLKRAWKYLQQIRKNSRTPMFEHDHGGLQDMLPSFTHGVLGIREIQSIILDYCPLEISKWKLSTRWKSCPIRPVSLPTIHMIQSQPRLLYTWKDTWSVHIYNEYSTVEGVQMARMIESHQHNDIYKVEKDHDTWSFLELYREANIEADQAGLYDEFDVRERTVPAKYRLSGSGRKETLNRMRF